MFNIKYFIWEVEAMEAGASNGGLGEEEDMEEYCVGGYHPVHPGDVWHNK